MWISATATRNFMLDDPVLDWFELYGKKHGFTRDTDANGYDSRADYSHFLFKKGRSFEASVLTYLQVEIAKHDKKPVVRFERAGALNPEELAGKDYLAATVAAMIDGAPAIHQGMVCDDRSKTYGFPDFLIRSDIFVQLFPNMAEGIPAKSGAPGIKTSGHHYIVVDSKFTTVKLNAQMELGNDESQQAYKAQLFIYNRALGSIQQFTPQFAYLLGRGWRQGKTRVENAVDRLGPVARNATLTFGAPLEPKTEAAIAWARRLHKEGAAWSPGAKPSTDELRPNMKNTEDSPWHFAKQQVAAAQGEITTLWQAGIEARRKSVKAGITDWKDPRCTAASLEIKGAYSAKAQAIIDVNRDGKDPAVRPAHVSAGEAGWRPAGKIEFFVDFETVNNLDDDFAKFPEKGGQALIFMIGCGHVEDGSWRFSCFTAKWLDEASESTIIDEWISHMEQVRKRLAPEVLTPKVYHWSFAEVSTLESAYNSAISRHGAKWKTPEWYDLLKNAVQAEPIVVRGSLRFGLKSVAKALHALGHIETKWKDGIVDGLGAMAAAWWADHEARRTNVAMETLALMKNVIEYNEIDCRVMMETLRYIRAHH